VWKNSPVKPSYLIRGFPGHPLHPPLTDATIGLYTGAFAFAILSVAGVAEEATAKGWWLLLVAGLIVGAATAVTGLADWLTITRRTQLWWTATWHMLSMVSATVFFLVTAILGHADYVDGEVSGTSLVLTVIAYGMLTLGGWLGGSIVFVHGMRVLNLVDEPTERAVSPGGREKEMAEGR
jgi:uncharacterized membrane protein